MMVNDDAQVIMNKNFFLGVAGVQCPQLIFFKFLELSETSRDRQLIFGLLVNKDVAR